MRANAAVAVNQLHRPGMNGCLWAHSLPHPIGNELGELGISRAQHALQCAKAVLQPALSLQQLALYGRLTPFHLLVGRARIHRGQNKSGTGANTFQKQLKLARLSAEHINDFLHALKRRFHLFGAGIPVPLVAGQSGLGRFMRCLCRIHLQAKLLIARFSS